MKLFWYFAVFNGIFFLIDYFYISRRNGLAPHYRYTNEQLLSNLSQYSFFQLQRPLDVFFVFAFQKLWVRWLHFPVLFTWKGTVLQWALALIFIDFLYYAWHWLQHSNGFLWFCHRVHHQDRNMNVLTARRLGLFDGTLYAPIPIIVGLPAGVILGLIYIRMSYMLWIHAAVPRLPPTFEFLFNSASHHRVHHEMNASSHRNNCGGILIIWDRIFGTFKKETSGPVKYGISEEEGNRLSPVRDLFGIKNSSAAIGPSLVDWGILTYSFFISSILACTLGIYSLFFLCLLILILFEFDILKFQGSVIMIRILLAGLFIISSGVFLKYFNLIPPDPKVRALAIILIMAFQLRGFLGIKGSFERLKKSFAGVIGFCLIFSCLSLAALASNDLFLPGHIGKQIEGVPVPSSGTLKLETSVPVTLLGIGVRKNRIRGVERKISVTQLFGSDPKKFVRTPNGALDSLAKMRSAALRFTSFQSVRANIAYLFYLRGIKKLGIHKSEALQKYLDAVIGAGDSAIGGSGPAQQSIVVASYHSPTGEEIFYQDQNGKVTKIIGGAGFIKTIFSFWLGESADNGLAVLKSNLLKRPEL